MYCLFTTFSVAARLTQTFYNNHGILVDHVQVLQLQSASTSPKSQSIDYESGIEAMVLAILLQTNYSQETELAELSDLTLQMTQDDLVAYGFLLTAYNAYLADALAANSNLTDNIRTSLLNISTSSVLPVVLLCKSAMCKTALVLPCC